MSAPDVASLKPATLAAKRSICTAILYLAEFDHRYNHRVGLGYSDIDRTFAAIKGAEGKRLLYRQPH